MNNANGLSKCNRIECKFERHPDLLNNNGTYCCKKCMNQKGHGTLEHGSLCKRVIFINKRIHLYKLGFIHITKTGGTNLKRIKNSDVFYGCYHYEDGLFYKNENMPCFAVLRDPIERYKSLFYYNNYGSNIYPNRAKRKIVDINEFVRMHYKDGKKFIDYYEEGVQFKSQAEWLNGDAEKTYIVLFDKNKLMHNIIELFNKLGIKFDNIDFSNNVNATNYKNNTELTSSSIDILKEIYKNDIQLYESLLSKNVPFCKLSEIK